MDAIGLVSDAITIVSFFTDQVPSSPDQGTAVMIKAGLGGINADESDHVRLPFAVKKHSSLTWRSTL